MKTTRRNFIKSSVTAGAGAVFSSPVPIHAVDINGYSRKDERPELENNTLETVDLDNDYYYISVNKSTGAITSFLVKKNQCDLIAEKRLAVNFRICLPLKEYACNYID